MTSRNVSLPKTLKEYVEGQVAAGAYSTPSEYMRELIREDQKRRARENLEAALLEGLQSGAPAGIGGEYWARKRKALRERHKAARATG
ncbi:MAG TPA: type II toxin-antitoxin system ParD family antitoxin [Terriglobia bacterium]|nr:type II toxin-antitoxin system ParD family antitoxin [Terriglobia bacterium]